MLCLAADVSESVKADEYELQRKGHASAIEDPDIVALIEKGLHGRIAAEVSEVRDEAVRRGIVINVLTIQDTVDAAHHFTHTRTKGGRVSDLKTRVTGGEDAPVSYAERPCGQPALAKYGNGANKRIIFQIRQSNFKSALGRASWTLPNTS